MTTYEQIKAVMQGKNGMVVTSAFIKAEVKKKFGTNINSVIPSDFCCNRTNCGIRFSKDNRLFEYLGRVLTNIWAGNMSILARSITNLKEVKRILLWDLGSMVL